MTAVLHDQILNADTSMGAVTLRVGDLENMSDYYSRAFGLDPIEEVSRDREVHRMLGRGQTPFVRLVHTPDLPEVAPHQAGLFHTAFLFETPASLSATVYRAAQDSRSRFVGASDHLVSEAFYFTDPEGNGVELYTDRDRDQWVHHGTEIQMTTEHLDAQAYLNTHLTQETLDAGSALPGTVGHVHLQVGDLQTAREFYVGALGFEVTQTQYRGALFASAGGYHHHIAMNVWNSAGSGPRAASLGLGNVSITVPGRADIETLTARLRARSIVFRGDERSVSVSDPWGTQVTVGQQDLSSEELIAR